MNAERLEIIFNNRQLAMSSSEEIIDFGVEPPPQQDTNPQHKVAHKRMEATKAQIDEVTGILKKNVDLILQRDEKLSDLDGRADALNDEASEFGKQTGKLKRKFWWQNCKMLAILIGVCFVLIVIIIVWAISVEP
ncbi:hypothetical protein JTE90_023298 [Oedothorax gibbosus]|uniref:V-SNARE coiled-coil homology domain-containing protein n=1 Tax=Oedothorax gibbosus TaxID=931172 RepID=A0AAV6UMS1_9ARAC|nr:hypothetical protein JTE90_023298 [Oedothorax gibbosus]